MKQIISLTLALLIPVAQAGADRLAMPEDQLGQSLRIIKRRLDTRDLTKQARFKSGTHEMFELLMIAAAITAAPIARGQVVSETRAKLFKAFYLSSLGMVFMRWFFPVLVGRPAKNPGLMTEAELRSPELVNVFDLSIEDQYNLAKRQPELERYFIDLADQLRALDIGLGATPRRLRPADLPSVPLTAAD